MTLFTRDRFCFCRAWQCSRQQQKRQQRKRKCQGEAKSCTERDASSLLCLLDLIIFSCGVYLVLPSVSGPSYSVWPTVTFPCHMNALGRTEGNIERVSLLEGNRWKNLCKMKQCVKKKTEYICSSWQAVNIIQFANGSWICRIEKGFSTLECLLCRERCLLLCHGLI